MNKRRFETDWSKKMETMKKPEKKERPKDERIYLPKMKEDGTGFAVVRLLPSIDTDLDWVTMYRHGFGKNGLLYINNCRSTLGEKGCLSCKKYFELYDKEKGADNSGANLYKRKNDYYTNILIIEDPETPSNVGKVFLFKYNYEVNDIIIGKMQPKNTNIKPVFVFDYYEGANLNLVTSYKQFNGVDCITYKGTEFDGKSSLGTDDEIEAIRSKCYSLKEIIAPDKFKSKEELDERFIKVDSGNAESNTPKMSGPKANISVEVDEPVKATKSETKEEPVVEETFDTNDDDAFFKKLKNN